MDPQRRKLLRLIVGAFLIGLVLTFIANWQLQSPAGLRYPLFFETLQDVGSAAFMAAIVGLLFEWALFFESKQGLTEEIQRALPQWERMRDQGFREIYPDRQAVFDTLFDEAIPEAHRHIRIMGICISAFKEAGRWKRRAKDFGPEGLEEVLINRIRAGCQVQVLSLKRYPTPVDLESYGTNLPDLFFMRERDEDRDDSFYEGKRLKTIANKAVGHWIDLTVRLAHESRDRSDGERRELLARIHLREYIALPSVSLYIVDDRIFVTPYLYKRHCSDVPAFVVAGRDTPLYSTFAVHFKEAWSMHNLVSDTLPPQFITLLANDPHTTVQMYAEQKAVLEAEREQHRREGQITFEDPEYWRIQEQAVEACASSLSPAGR